MMKNLVFACLLLFGQCLSAQEWLLEVSGGISAYNGDLTQKEVSIKRMRPAASLSLKYNTGGMIDFRGGVFYGRVTADDKNNPQKDLHNRNLNFTSDIFEVNFVAELNLFDPDLYNAFPYFFGGIGVFYFNPYSFDKDGKKTFLRPLSTEGQGLPEYPDRKVYSLVQPCLPVGMGWKWHYKKRIELAYEIGFRIIFTDYLDDVSETYADIETLIVRKGLKTAEFAYRKIGVPFAELGEKRGNSSKRDVYFFSGLKISFQLGGGHKKRKSDEPEEVEEVSMY